MPVRSPRRQARSRRSVCGRPHGFAQLRLASLHLMNITSFANLDIKGCVAGRRVAASRLASRGISSSTANLVKNGQDQNVVVMVQCYVRDASDSTLEDMIARLRAYHEEAGIDWVQFESPHSVDDIRAARTAYQRGR
jgi:hypothetical protein